MTTHRQLSAQIDVRRRTGFTPLLYALQPDTGEHTHGCDTVYRAQHAADAKSALPQARSLLLRFRISFFGPSES